MPAKPQMGGGGAGGFGPHAEPGSWAETYPNVAGYMTDAFWPDHTPRKASRLFIDVFAGQWRMVLKEGNQMCELTVLAADPGELLPLLEAVLKSPNPPWSADQWAIEQAKKKKK